MTSNSRTRKHQKNNRTWQKAVSAVGTATFRPVLVVSPALLGLLYVIRHFPVVRSISALAPPSWSVAGVSVVGLTCSSGGEDERGAADCGVAVATETTTTTPTSADLMLGRLVPRRPAADLVVQWSLARHWRQTPGARLRRASKSGPRQPHWRHDTDDVIPQSTLRPSEWTTDCAVYANVQKQNVPDSDPDAIETA